MSVDELTRDNIRNLVNKEEGGSLYRLVKNMIKISEKESEPKTETVQLADFITPVVKETNQN